MRIALVGCGAVTQAVYVPLLSRRRDLFEVVAVCDLSRTLADAVGDRLGAGKRYTAVADMLADGGFEAVVVLASGSHGETVRQALSAGYAVLCEKPLALTRAEVAALPEGRLMVGYMKQYDPAVRRAEKLLAELGGPAAIRAVEVTVLHPSGESQLAFANLTQARDVDPGLLASLRAAEDELVSQALGADAPKDVRGLYGVALGSICHDLSLLRRFTGSPADISYVETWGETPGSIEISGPPARDRPVLPALALPGGLPGLPRDRRHPPRQRLTRTGLPLALPHERPPPRSPWSPQARAVRNGAR
ncbi:Gfo/Idh/MocA family oxidoreductase [Nonomuraea salmonea]|uniref:Gfo/Idh/MocA family protein n=1 Tax=Nonomuraea salmonea TaxID=46181 RepID=UPI002FE86625